MAKTPGSPKKSGRTPNSKAPNSKAPNSKAHRPDVEPIGPALAELLNPAINRGDAGMGSGTGLKPPPDNSWDRRAGGEAAAHRARASTRDKSDDVAKRDASSSPPHAPSFPPPLWGRAREGGEPSNIEQDDVTPTPNPSPQGGGEQGSKGSAST